MKDFNIWLGEEEKIIVFSNTDKYNNVTVHLKNINGDVIYKTDSIFTKGVSFWYKVNISLKELKTIFVELYSGDNLIQKNEVYIDKQLSIYVDIKLGLGDFMWVTPFIRKLSNLYNKKVDVYGFSIYQEFLKNNPYVNNFYDRTKFNKEEINAKNENFDVFYEQTGYPYFYSDLRQLACKSAGITLKEEECDLDYIPYEYIEIKELPKDYVVINPRLMYPERTFNHDEQWQELVDLINDLGIPVVTIGVGPSSHHKNLKIRNGVNLVYDERQNNLSQTWHIINNSKCFITFDTGMYIFAGTTDTNILLIGWTCDPWFHQPIRKGDRNYKFHTVRGNCEIYCTTDPKSNIAEYGTIKKMHKSNYCILDKNYKCIPSPKMIVNKLKEIYE